MVRVKYFIFVGLMLFSFSDPLWAQDAIYHLHKEASSTSGLLQLKTNGPDAGATKLTVSLNNKAPGEYLIKAFDTQASVPNLAGTIDPNSSVTFTLWMRKTATAGTMYPRAKLTVNSVTGAALCTTTGTTALTTTLTKYILSCTTATYVPMATTDRYYLWVGVNITAGPGNTSINGQVSVEGTLNGNYDSQVNVPLPVAECNNGIDEDWDQRVDMNDPDCSSPTDDSENFFRQPLCAADGEYRIVAIYMNAPGISGMPNSNRYNKGAAQRVRDNMALINGKIWKDAQKFGASRDLKVKCNAAGVTDVINLVSSVPGDQYGSTTAAAAGYNSTFEQYWIFLDNCHDTASPANCNSVSGWGSDQGCQSESASIDNCNNHGPRWSSAYGNILTFGTYKWGAANTMAQEGLHGMGIMNKCAPHAAGGTLPYTCPATKENPAPGGYLAHNESHGNDGRDVMSAGPLCQTGEMPFDCNNDDFFHPSPDPGTYLANNWNLGASYVRWFDDDGIYPWTGYDFDAEHQHDATTIFYPSQMTRTTTDPGVPWQRFADLPASCSLPAPQNAPTNGPAVYGFAAASWVSGECYYTQPTAKTVGEMTFNVDLSRTSSPTLSWWDLFDIRNECMSCDYLRVDYSTDGGSTWTNLWGWLGVSGDQTTWVKKGPYNLAAGCNANVKIRFQFDTRQASTGEQAKGWFVDGIKIRGTEGGCGG